MNRSHSESRRIALGGVLSALAVVLLSLGGIVPFAMFCCPMLAMLCFVPVVESCGTRTSLIFYAAVSLLGIILAPDKEVALLFIFLGYYPAVRPLLDRAVHSRWLRVVVKLLLFAVSISVMYALAIYVFDMGYIAEEYAGARGLLAVTAVMGCVVWLLFDRVLDRFTRIYRSKHRKK